MARCLIIGCGCRGLMLARELASRGHAVRGTTRDPGRVPELEAAGVEARVADPDRVATMTGVLEHVTVACILLGSAVGSAEELAALHGSRLEALLTKMVDTNIVGVAYEAGGTVDPGLLRAGAERVRSFAARAHAGCALISADPGTCDAWATAAASAVEQLLEPG